jgi:Ni,Fe-hydrogenase maturation factor
MQNSKETKYRELLDELLELQEELRTSRKRSTDAFPFAQAEEALDALLSGLQRAVDTMVEFVLKQLDKRRKQKRKP